MYYQIPHGLLYRAEQAAVIDATDDQQRGAIRRASEFLWSTRRVLLLGDQVTINSPHGSIYYSNGVTCDCKCNHSRYACWPREAAKLIRRLQEMEAARQQTRQEVNAAVAELFPS